jgi:hypothetical protein
MASDEMLVDPVDHHCGLHARGDDAAGFDDHDAGGAVAAVRQPKQAGILSTKEPDKLGGTASHD